MKFFITGSTGYIGQQLCLKLGKQGHSLVALVRSPEKAKYIEFENVKVVYGDLNSRKVLNENMNGCDGVFHLAGYARTSPLYPGIYEEINIEGTRNILSAALENGVGKVLFTSTAGVFGPSANGALTEDSKRKMPFFNEYEETKFKAEQLCKEFVSKGLDVTIVNPPRVYGPGFDSESNAVTKLIDRYINGNWRWIPGNGNRKGCYAFIDDVVNGHILAMEKGKPGERYALGGENVSYNEIFDKIAEVSGLRRKMIKVPVRVLEVFSTGMVTWSKIARKPPLITPKWIRKYLFDWEVSSEKAIRELGYKITPLEVGIKKTVNWLRQENADKYALITGASAGLGRALSEKCAARGMNLVLVSLPETGLEKIQKKLQEKYSVKVEIIEVNLTHDNAPQEIVDHCVKNNLEINVLINNAGLGSIGIFSNTNLGDINYMMRLNMTVIVRMVHLFLPLLRKNEKGYILNIGSTASIFPIPYKTIYSATKSFVYSFSRSLYYEVKKDNIHVSCLCPGPINTNGQVIESNRQMGWKSKLFIKSPETVADLAVERMFAKQFLIIPGLGNWLGVKIGKVLPHALLGYLLARTFKKHDIIKEQIKKKKENIRPGKGIASS